MCTHFRHNRAPVNFGLVRVEFETALAKRSRLIRLQDTEKDSAQATLSVPWCINLFLYSNFVALKRQWIEYRNLFNNFVRSKNLSNL